MCNYDCTNIYEGRKEGKGGREEGRKEGWAVKVASKSLKIEYFVVGGMCIEESAPILCASKLLWVYESSEG